MKLNFIEGEFSHESLNMSNVAFLKMRSKIMTSIVKYIASNYDDYTGINILNIIAKHCETKEQLSYFSYDFNSVEAHQFIGAGVHLVIDGFDIDANTEKRINEIIGT